MKYAPVLISVYDRINHLKQCIDSLKENPEAKFTDLFVTVDYPLKEEDLPKIQAVLNYLETISGFKTINIIKREHNFGPGKNMRAAIKEVLGNYDRLISMEDDNIVSNDFLSYMNRALEFYENDERIVSISAYNYPIDVPKSYKNDVYIWPAINGYGIAYWRDKNFLDYLELNDFEKFIIDDNLINGFMNVAEHILPILFDGLLKGRLYGDAVISYNYFMKGKFNLFPVVSRVKNIGYDGSGENCETDERFVNQQLITNSKPVRFVKNIQPDKEINKILFDFFKISRERKEYTKKVINAFREEIKKRKFNNSNLVISPLSLSTEVKLEREIPVEFILKQYAAYGIDTTKYFEGLQKIKLYKCEKTDFRFFYPLTLAGDGKFYEQLQKIPWYYMEDKWEFDVALNLIQTTEKVLEIGSGKGAFLRKAKQKGVNIFGAELNKSQAQKLNQEGFVVYDENLSALAENRKETFDVVCSFQVLEHVPNPKEFIEDSLKLLKVGGRLIVSVPNHDSFLGLDDENFLDMPPHHMGLWDEKSLMSLEDIFPLKVKSVHLEPLQDYHKDYYKSIFAKKYNDEFLIKEKIFERVEKNRNEILGFTILVEYEKI